MELSLKYFPDSILRQSSKKIIKFNYLLTSFANKLLEVCKKHEGLGISAIQVGTPIRLIIVSNGNSKFIFMCNPEIQEQEQEQEIYEGCLSFKNLFIKRKRPAKIKIKFQDLKGKKQSLICYDLLAQCVVHEIEHLDGKLLID